MEFSTRSGYRPTRGLGMGPAMFGIEGLLNSSSNKAELPSSRGQAGFSESITGDACFAPPSTGQITRPDGTEAMQGNQASPKHSHYHIPTGRGLSSQTILK